MIILKCSKCKEQLEVDDGFAGGVCRCVHCGALSQVPLQATVLDKKGRPTAPPPMAKPVTAVVEAELTIAPTRRSTLSQKRQGTLAMILIVVALLMAAGIGVLAMKMFGKKDDGSGDGSGGGTPTVATTHQGTSVQTVKGPSIVGLPIPGKSVAYLLNAGNSMAAVADYAQVAIVESVKRLDKAEFVVLPWRTGEKDPKEQPAYPKAGLSPAGKAAEVTDWFRSTSMIDARDPELAATEAVKRGAATIVLITRYDLESGEVDRLAKLKDVTWLALAISTASEAKTEDYPQLVRLAGEKSVSAVTESDLKTFLEQLGN